jgi:RimJ/RimL family protein N-acetyltransferase
LPANLELTDGVIRLRPWSTDVVDDLTRIWQDRELQQRFDVEAPVTREAVSAYVDGVRARWRDDVQISLAIVAGRALVGGCDLDHLDTDRPDLGYWLAPDARGQGYATRAGALLLAWAEAQLGCSTVCLEVEADNAPSIAVAERLGFVRAHGVERTVDDRRLRVYQLSISR